MKREDSDGDPRPLLPAPLSPSFELRAVSVAPGGVHMYRESDWRDALIVVDRGQIELESLFGSRRRFRRGDVLWFAGLPLRALRNRGSETAVLLAISRRGDALRLNWPVVPAHRPISFKPARRPNGEPIPIATTRRPTT